MRYLTKTQGIGGELKVKWDDFQVAEVLPFGITSSGEHTVLEIEKRGISTFDAIEEIACMLGISRSRFGYGGLKDARAVTRQHLSVWNVPPENFTGIETPDLKVLWAKKHSRKLKRGCLSFNKFKIRISGCAREALGPARETMAELQSKGVPNYYGQQRFGIRGINHAIGRAMLLGDWEKAVSLFAGTPSELEGRGAQNARLHFEKGEVQAALESFPPKLYYERRLAENILKGKPPEAAFCLLPQSLRKLFVSAYQSHLFNKQVDERIDMNAMDTFFAGDLAMIGSKYFSVDEPEKLAERLSSFELSPSGVLYGYKVRLAEGKWGEIEKKILSGENIRPEVFKMKSVGDRGARRPLRFKVTGPSVEFDDGIVVEFALPKGCYATTVLGEIMKNDNKTLNDLT